MDMLSFLERAKNALESPTLYWLGTGGWVQGQAPSDLPGKTLDLERALEEMGRLRPKVYAKYIAEEQRSGIDRATLPKISCDCSGFVCWALGISRNGWPESDDWFNTDGMVTDANGEQRYFARVQRAVPGALLVHPSPSLAGGPGHVAIVTEVDAHGEATRMLHCSPRNYLLSPPPGLKQNAIAETDTRHFDNEPQRQFVMWKAFM